MTRSTTRQLRPPSGSQGPAGPRRATAAQIELEADGTVRHWDAGAARLYGYSARQMVGQPIARIEPRGGAGAIVHRAALCEGPLAGFAARHLRRDGALIEVDVALAPVRDAAGALTGIACRVCEPAAGGAERERRRADRLQVERAREQMLAELQDAQRLAGVGSWTWNTETMTGSWSAEAYRLFGRDPARGPASGDEMIDYAVLEDRLIAARADWLTAASAPVRSEFRTVGDDGVPRTLVVVGRSDPEHPGQYWGTVQDVTEIRRAERERIDLLEASLRAEESNRAKSEFLARMSHELRTPLNAIIGFAQLLELEALADRQREDVGYIRRAGSHLLALINDSLDLARIESGRLAISPEPVAIEDVIEEASALLAPLAAERDVTVARSRPPDAPALHVRADRNRVKQVLINLVSNAIKYNRFGGRVDLSFGALPGGRVTFTVADTGIGIEADHLAALFLPFERLGAEQTEVEGTGLGLTLSKSLVEAMGGAISVHSEPGVGTTFTIELPAAEPGALATAAAARCQDRLDLRPRAGRPWRFLYIEDNLSNLALVRRILERHEGVTLLTARQGALGLELAREERPDLILLDLHLPDGLGLDVLRRLIVEMPQIPVVVVTADATPHQDDVARRLGAAAYLHKPLEISELYQAINGVLAGPA